MLVGAQVLRDHGAHGLVRLQQSQQHYAFGKMISVYLDRGAVVGAACRSAYAHEDTGAVSRDHMFSIVATKCVQGVRFLGLRTRWGKHSWNSFNALMHLYV